MPYRQILLSEHPLVAKFFGDRCTHLAGMIAYFGILSVIPATFLMISALAWTGGLEVEGYVVTQLRYALPEQSFETIVELVRYLQDSTRSLSVIGAVGLLWGATNFFSVIESALNIIYGVNNRAFLKQKAWVLFLMAIALTALAVSALLATFIVPLFDLAVSNDLITYDGTDAAVSALVSSVGAFVFFLSCYRFLPNTETHVRDLWPGALLGTVLFEVTIHALPLYLASSNAAIIIRAFAGALILLLWFYVMANILLAGAVLNWWIAAKRTRLGHAAVADKVQ